MTAESATTDSTPTGRLESGWIERFVQRAQCLYSLPTVAMEVLRLTSDEQASAGEIKRCIERDPAMTVKILKAVNSPLFGLSGQVSDLNQALALLGLKPLKLLVLGFSLPKEMLQGIEAEALSRYWQFSLTKAVAAREIAALQDKSYGDEAFIAGLLSEIGALVLLQDLGDAYAQFASKVRQEEADLLQMELETLGFDHAMLGCRLLQNWGLPEKLIEVIHRGQPSSGHDLIDSRGQAATLRLAHQLAEILVDHRMDRLPCVLDELSATTDDSPEVVDGLVIDIQEKLFPLANALSVILPDDTSYRDVIREAYHQLAQLSEEVSPLLALGDGEIRARIVGSREAAELVASARTVGQGIRADRIERRNEPLSDDPASTKSVTLAMPGFSVELCAALEQGMYSARAKRTDFTLLLLTIDHFEQILVSAGVEEVDVLQQLVAAAIDRQGDGLGRVLPCGDSTFAVLLEEHDRPQSVSLARQILKVVRDWSVNRLSHAGVQLTLSGGAASVCVPPKGLPPEEIFEAARRCMMAAARGGGNSVKSIEII